MPERPVRIGRWLGIGAAIAGAAYAACATVAWCGYGRPRPPSADERDDLLDRFMPAPEIVERHHVRVHARPDVTMAAACDLDLWSSPAIRAVFKGRELLLGGTADTRDPQIGLVAEMRSLGWGVLAEVPGRQIVLGAVTKPWEADVTFRAIPAGTFAAFAEPGLVKIAVTLRADPAGAGESVFRTETRAEATDACARSRFRRYWSLLSPGIRFIRRIMLLQVRRQAEQRQLAAAPGIRHA